MPMVITVPAYTDSSYPLRLFSYTFCLNKSVCNFIYVRTRIVVVYLKIPTTTFRAFLIRHRFF